MPTGPGLLIGAPARLVDNERTSTAKEAKIYAWEPSGPDSRGYSRNHLGDSSVASALSKGCKSKRQPVLSAFASRGPHSHKGSGSSFAHRVPRPV